MRLPSPDGGSVAGLRCVYGIVALTSIASAVPTITFPLNSQVPPVARVGQPFRYTLSPSTFTSDTALKYSLKSGPSWLLLDDETRTLSGVPPNNAKDVAEIQIEATDSTASTTMTSTLVVSSGTAPQVRIPLSQQIDKFAEYSAPNSLLFYPSASFKFSFDPETFSSGGQGGLNKYAVTLDNAPLPSWISFDAATMTFSGETPDSGSLISPPEQFGIQLIASKIIGFGEVSIPFYFVVQNHKLVWEDSFLSISTTPGAEISFKELSGKLELDGKSISASELASITSDAPQWLKFDTSTFALSGTVPDGTSSLNVTITAKDKFNDVAAVSISIAISSGIFSNQDIPPLNATIGEAFSFNVSNAFVDPAKVDISVFIVPDTPWLSYDPATFILAGEVPDSATASSVTVTLSANTKAGLSKRATDTKSFIINVLPPTSIPGNTPTGDTSNTTPASNSDTATPATIAELGESNPGISPGQIAAAVVVPNILLILALLLLFWCWRRRQHRQLIEKAGFTPMKKNISRPQLQDPTALMTPSSTSSLSRGLRSHRPGFAEDTSIYTRPEHNRRSVSMPKVRRSLSTMRSSFLSHPLHRSISDNYITYGLPSLPSTQSRDMSSKLGTIQTATPVKKRDSQLQPRYKPYRTFSEHSEVSGSIQITPEASYMHNYGQHRISKSKPKARNYLGSIDGLPTQRYSVVGHGHGRTLSTASNQLTDTPVRHRLSGLPMPNYGHSGRGGVSVDSDTSWLTVQSHAQSSPAKSLGPGAGRGSARPNSAMSAVTENTDLLYSYSDLAIPQLPPAVVTSSSSDTRSSNYAQRNTIRIVSQSSDVQPHPLPSSNTLASSISSLNRPITRRGGSSPFFAGSARTNSRATRRRSAKVIGGYLFSDEPENSPSLAERDETNASLERSILSELQMDTNSLASRSNSRLDVDILGINYGGQTPDLISRRQSRKSRVYPPGAAYRSPEESNKQLQTFITDLRHRPSWQDSRQQSVLSHSNLSDASSRFREATNSPPAFSFPRYNVRTTADKENDGDNDDVESRYSDNNDIQPHPPGTGARRHKYTSYQSTSHLSARSMGAATAATFRDSMGNSIRYADDESPALSTAAYVERPSLLSAYNPHISDGERGGRGEGGLDPTWRLTPMSPRQLELGSSSGRVREGPERRGTVRMSHGREGSLSIANFLETAVDEQRKRAEREGTPGGAFL